MKRLTVNASKALCAFMLCMGLLFSGCYDDADLRAQLKEHSEQLSDHESRLKELERLWSQANTNIEALQAIVTALNDRDYVTGVAPIMEGKIVLGYTITFSKSGPVTIYHGQDGQNGTVGYAPALGVKQDGEEWYWTVDGQWLTDADGNKVRASAKDGQDGKPGNDGAAGVTPTLKIEEGYWYVSYDGGKTWESESLGQATGDKGDSMFEKVLYDAEYVYITMSDGQQLTLPRTSASQSEGSVGPATIALEKTTATTATFNGHLDVPASYLPISQITIYYSDAETFHVSSAQTVIVTSFDENQSFTTRLTKLKCNTQYNYCIYVKVKSDEYYSEVKTFTTSMVSVDLTVTESTIVSAKSIANFSGSVSGLDEEDELFLGVFYTKYAEELESIQESYFYILFENVCFPEIGSDGTFTVSSNPLDADSKYYYLYFIISAAGEVVSAGEVKEFTTKEAPVFFKVPIMGVDFAVFGYAHDGDGGYSPETSVVDLYMDEVRCAYVSEGIAGVNNVWKPLTDNYYWPQAKSLAFIAASPSQDVPAPECGYNISSTKSALTIEYTAPDDLEKQVDILYSDWKTDCVKDACAAEGVELAFNHALSVVRINVRAKDAFSAENVRVTGLSINKVYKSGVFTSDEIRASQSWSFAGKTRADYTVLAQVYDATMEAGAPYTGSKPIVYAEDGSYVNFANYILLPQTYDSDSNITINFSIKCKVIENGVYVEKWLQQAHVFKLNDAVHKVAGANGAQITEWAMGTRYTYDVTIGVDEIYYALSVSGWDDVFVDASISPAI